MTTKNAEQRKKWERLYKGFAGDGDALDEIFASGGAPSGAAGGDLGGTYPNPTVNDGADSTAIHDDTASEISAITAKATPTTSDFLLIEDAAAANAKKRITIGDLPSGGGGAATGGQETFNLSNYSAGLDFVTATGTAFFVRFVSMSSFTATRMACYIVQTAAYDVQMGLYDSAGTQIAETTAEAAGGSNALQVVSLNSSVALTAGTEYFMALWGEQNSSVQFGSIDGRGSADSIANIGQNLNSGLPASRPGGGPSVNRPYIAVLSDA